MSAFRGIDHIDEIVAEFCETVDAMSERTRKLFAEYGRRWEVIIDTVVPVKRVCSLKLSEQHPWIQAPSKIMQQVLPFGDSTTTHIEIRATDHGVVIDHPDICDLAGKSLGVAGADEIRKTADTVAIYSSTTTERCFRRVQVRARVRLVHRLLIRCLMLLMVVVGLAALVLLEDNNLVGSLSLLVFPVTLVGAVVISLESTPLAERLLRRWKIGLVLAITMLWVVTLSRLRVYADITQMVVSGWSQLMSFTSWFKS